MKQVLSWVVFTVTATVVCIFCLAAEPPWVQSGWGWHDSEIGEAIDDVGAPLLRTSLLGRLEPGAEPRLAVRWDGPPGALLDVWVDLDGDDALDPGELVVRARVLDPGVDVVALDIPSEAYAVPEPDLWVRAQEAVRLESLEELPLDAVSSVSCAWQPGFQLYDLDGAVLASTVYDDGTGPALYVGGSFRYASGTMVNRIARWDGSSWSALSGPSGAGASGQVMALAVYDDGTGPALYAGGSFSKAGGVSAHRVARWNGSSWSALSGPSGEGTDNAVRTLAVYDDGGGSKLYVGGYFDAAGGVPVSHVASWDGSSWSALTGPSGTGTDGEVMAFDVYDDGDGSKLYVGGWFDTAGGSTVNHIASWDGASWSALSGPSGTGLNQQVEALAVFDHGTGPELYAGGYFTRAGGVTASHIARWDGSSWSELDTFLGEGTDGAVLALTVHDDGTGPELHVGGEFERVGGFVVAHNIARWDGSSWGNLGGTDSKVLALTVYDDGSGPALFVGGTFGRAGDAVTNRIARWDGSSWSALSDPSGMATSDAPLAFAAYDDSTGPALYVGGGFLNAGGLHVNRIARWDGSSWSALSGPSDTGTSGPVRALAVYDDATGPALYAGGYVWSAGGVTVNHCARWNGSSWSALSGPSGTGMNASVNALAVYDDGTGPALYAGGEFDTAGGVNAYHIATWNGSSWSAVGNLSFGYGTDDVVQALEVYDDGTGPALYVGGMFASAGIVAANHIARWDGSSWSALSGPSGDGTDDRIEALEVYDDGTGPALFAGGMFTTAGGVLVNHIARWDGSSWSALSGPSGIGMANQVLDLAVHDDGTGPALYAGGIFSYAGGVLVNNVARWGGSSWSALSGPSGTGTDTLVYSLAEYDGGTGAALHIGGAFATAGGLVSNHFAIWRCSSLLFADGFESGSTGAWSATMP